MNSSVVLSRFDWPGLGALGRAAGQTFLGAPEKLDRLGKELLLRTKLWEALRAQDPARSGPRWTVEVEPQRQSESWPAQGELSSLTDFLRPSWCFGQGPDKCEVSPDARPQQQPEPDDTLITSQQRRRLLREQAKDGPGSRDGPLP